MKIDKDLSINGWREPCKGGQSPARFSFYVNRDSQVIEPCKDGQSPAQGSALGLVKQADLAGRRSAMSTILPI